MYLYFVPECLYCEYITSLTLAVLIYLLLHFPGFSIATITTNLLQEGNTYDIESQKSEVCYTGDTRPRIRFTLVVDTTYLLQISSADQRLCLKSFRGEKKDFGERSELLNLVRFTRLILLHRRLLHHQFRNL